MTSARFLLDGIYAALWSLSARSEHSSDINVQIHGPKESKHMIV